ncbi:suppressor of lurcher protein 1-like isoform X2 [Tachypleus tridentatus]|uniref:suppressor of lurcher protein 1-like isoform X2 n=1 Tax=Tachypleus tridentatus TaxID=6853 RepID=UPI003FD195AA
MVECDRMFISNPDGRKNGSFSSLEMLNPYNHSRQCIYTFIAAENERVKVTFTVFRLKGAPPECAHEFVDLYTEIEDSATELIKTPFGGRYCGKILPQTRISLYQTLVISFYTDRNEITSDVFRGTYEFVDATQYELGTPLPTSVCSFTIFTDHRRKGKILSPTYPGVYPKNLKCQYKFLGAEGQRVRLEFMDFDLFYGGRHCPFDLVQVYDGATTQDPLIDTYCGQQRNLVVYSSAENLLVLFITLKRTANTQNRGFSGWFEFSESFTKLGFIENSGGQHIRGTECDQKVFSKGHSNGTVYSPDWSSFYHPNTVCKYYVYGLNDRQNLERVTLTFEQFDIPSENKDCEEAYLKVYLNGQETKQAFDEYDHVFCGQELPVPLVSNGPRLFIVFSSGPSQGRGFKAIYTFETEYKIPGTPAPDDTCHFTYRSESRKSGEFNSPRYPANYPSSTHCQYYFHGLQGDQVQFVFNYFKTKTLLQNVPGYNEVCKEDWLEIYEIYPNGREKALGRYCSTTSPGPVVSNVGIHDMKVVLKTNEEGVASGFSATYQFIESKQQFQECGENISGHQYGLIKSPGFPDPYEPHRQVCTWFVNVRPYHKVLLVFDDFLIEGDPVVRGCPGAVVRVWPDLSLLPIELCGEALSNSTRQILSVSTILKLQFLSANKAVGSKGFKAVWTEVKEVGTSCRDLFCANSGFCISPDLKCNDIFNCGLNDYSDETNCIRTVEVKKGLVIGISVGVALLSVSVLCVVCHRKKRRRRRRNSVPPFERPPQQPREVPGMHFVSVDSV